MGLTSISLSWRVPGDSTLDSEVMWRELRGILQEKEVAVAPAALSPPPPTPSLTYSHYLYTISQWLSTLQILVALLVNLWLPLVSKSDCQCPLKLYILVLFVVPKSAKCECPQNWMSSPSVIATVIGGTVVFVLVVVIIIFLVRKHCQLSKHRTRNVKTNLEDHT